MRTLLAATALLVAGPVSAQIESRALPNVGYDVGYDGPSVGLGVEAVWAPAGSPVSLALRPSADVVFVRPLRYGSPLQALPAAGQGTSADDGRSADVFRVGVEAVVRWEQAPLPAVPYLKVGLVSERESYSESVSYTGSPGAFGSWESGPVAGGGVAFGPTYAELTHGFGDASRNRLAAGVRF